MWKSIIAVEFIYPHHFSIFKTNFYFQREFTILSIPIGKGSYINNVFRGLTLTGDSYKFKIKLKMVCILSLQLSFFNQLFVKVPQLLFELFPIGIVIKELFKGNFLLRRKETCFSCFIIYPYRQCYTQTRNQYIANRRGYTLFFFKNNCSDPIVCSFYSTSPKVVAIQSFANRLIC